MKVRDCKKCTHYDRHRYSTYKKPKNYHPIGIPHVYGFCELLHKKCSEVKKSECDDAKELRLKEIAKNTDEQKLNENLAK